MIYYERMKTIEEKAWGYSDSRRKDADLTDVATAFHDGYIQGATEALQSQWRSVEEELPVESCMCLCFDGERIFIAEWVDLTKQGGLSGWSIYELTKQPKMWLPIPKYGAKEGEQ